MTADIDLDYLSSTCAVAWQFGPPSGHARCRLTEDIPMPHSGGRITLIPRCHCTCHTTTGPEGDTAVETETTPPAIPVNDCAECAKYAEAAQSATARGDHSAAIDNRVRIATHDTGHNGTPGTP